jgi:peptide-methionine (S)-S-oxide reductase
MKIPVWSYVAVIGLGLAVFAMSPGRSSAEPSVAVPAPAVDESPATSTSETAVFAGGCFWGVQGVFQHVEGVRNAVSGYAGGAKDTAEYEVVSSGRTGHAESVKVTYDPSKITYGRLLQIYFSVAHDPTELNRQGPDSGTQYRSTIFPSNDDQAKVAKAYIDQLDTANTFGKKLATTIESGRTFYPAEGYHQDYLTLNPYQPYIVYNDLPKIAALKQMFPNAYRAKPVLTSEAGL